MRRTTNDFDKKHIFKIYRYQLLPVDRFVQGNLFDNYQSIEDIINKKNIIFNEILVKTPIKDTGNILIEKRLIESENFIISRYAVKRHITIETENFTETELNTWPSFLLCFWNAPDKQYMLIEENKKAYQDCKTIVNAIKGTFYKKLHDSHLNIHIEPLFEEKFFWDIIHKFDGQITSMKFEMVTPNMANISHMLDEDLKVAAKALNSQTTNLEFNSDSNAYLKIDDKNKMVQSLVSYASQGGGNITVKAKGIKRKIKTTKTVKTITFDEFELTTDISNLPHLIRGLLS